MTIGRIGQRDKSREVGFCEVKAFVSGRIRTFALDGARRGLLPGNAVAFTDSERIVGNSEVGRPLRSDIDPRLLCESIDSADRADT